MEYIYKKLIKYSSIFYKLRNKLPSSCLRSIYYAFVHPHILYGIEIYANMCSTYLKPLNVLVNKLLRTLQNCRLQTPVAQLYWEHHTLPVNQLFTQQILTLVRTFFYHNNELPEINREQFVINSTVHSHSTRQKSDLHICSVQKLIGQKSIQYVGSVLWNEIPQFLKNLMSRYTFKRKLKAHLLNELAVF